MKRALLAALTLMIILSVGISAIANSEEEKRLLCDENGNFTILVVSDPQCDTAAQWGQARDELETLVQRADPDFVLINGDMNTHNIIPAQQWDDFISPLTKRNIYWSTTNGNHDPFRYDYYRMYKSYGTCLNSTVDTTDPNYEASRPMNYCLPIYSNDGSQIVFAIYGMDSGTKRDGGYVGLTQKQINWYKAQSQKLKDQSGGRAVTSLLCMHIPLPQTLEMYYAGECTVYGRANEINYNTNGYVCKSGKKISAINVHTSSIASDNGTFNAILNEGDVKAVFFGHNHRNNFIGSYKGVLLGFVGKLSTGCYSDTVCRGGRVLRFNQSNPENFTVEWIGALPTSKDQPEIFSDGSIAK